MELTTLLFLGFFAAVALLNYTLPRVLRPYCLLAASYLFYCWGANDRLLVPVLVAATLVTWGCGLVIGKCRIGPVRVIFLLLAVFTCVGLLFYYKYWNLLAADILSGTVLQPRTDMVTPLGLGYFTLAALSYTIDVYKRRCKVELNPLHYALFVSFFPTMTTGPIERYPHFRPQIHKSRRFSYTRCAGGAFRMLWGYTKKMVIADNLSHYVSLVYGDVGSMSGPNLVAATVLFAVQLYMDFSGCCDIALGAARILGYDLIENFQSPFEARTFNDFWRRWQLGTIQVDYNLPERFELEYMGSDNQKHRPVMIHRAPFGSMERFVAVLIEHTAGKFPLWLTPEQVVILPISEKFNDYAEQVKMYLKTHEIRAIVDDRNEKIGRKIRDNEMKRIPYMLIVGEKEAENGEVSVRRQGEGDKGTMKFEEFAKILNEEVQNMINKW